MAKKVCIVCGKELEQKKHGSPRKYCSSKCSNAYHNARNAVKPQLPSGITQCPQCGKEFKREERSKRECCSLKCAHKWNWREEIKEIRQEAKERRMHGEVGEVREWVLTLHGRGYKRGAIVEALNLPVRTVEGWIERQNQDSALGKQYKATKYRHSYGYVQTADEWLSILRKDTWDNIIDARESIETRGRQINLVCGTRRGGKGADSLCVEIQGRLGMNPFSGDVFAFCSSERDRIRYMYWDGKGFRVISRRREKGTYPWPSEELGMTMPVSANDFEYLLYDDRISIGSRVSNVTLDEACFADENRTLFSCAST